MSKVLTGTVHIYLNYLVPLHIDSVLVLRVYSQFIVTHCVFIPCDRILILLSLHCWEGPVSKHFTVSLNLLFTKHVTNTISFDLDLFTLSLPISTYQPWLPRNPAHRLHTGALCI